MDFALTDELKTFQSGVRDFVEREITRDYVRECEAKEEFPHQIWAKMADAGYMGLIVPPEYGGAGLDYMHLALFLEQIARGCHTVASAYFVSSVFGADAIRHIGSEAQKREFLPRIAKGDIRFCFSLTKQSGGTDVLSSSSADYAAEEGDHFVINGDKVFTTGMDIADYALLVVRTKPADKVAKPHHGISLFIVPTRSPGIEMRRIETMGMKSLATFKVLYRDVIVPKSNLLGERDKGWYQLVNALNAERISVCAVCLGIQQAAFDITLEYAKQRQAFGKPIGQMQSIQHYLADMYCDLETSRMWTYKIASLATRGARFDVEAAMAKLMVAESAKRLNIRAMEIWLGQGFSKESDMERYFRDNTISLGPISNQMCRNYIGEFGLGLPKSY